MIICGGDRKTSYYRAAAHRTRSYNLLCMLEPLRDVPFNVRGAPDTARFSFHRGVSRTIQRSTCTMIQTACKPAIARTSQSTDFASKLTSSAPSMKPSYHWKSSIRKELREPGKLPSLTTKGVCRTPIHNLTGGCANFVGGQFNVVPLKPKASPWG